MNYYEFVADEYASVHLEHHFNGRLFSRVPLLRKLNWREIIGVKAVYGTVSDENKAHQCFRINVFSAGRRLLGISCRSR